MGRSTSNLEIIFIKDKRQLIRLFRLGGATVARSTPDRKAACSNHVRVIYRLPFCPSALLFDKVEFYRDQNLKLYGVSKHAPWDLQQSFLKHSS